MKPAASFPVNRALLKTVAERLAGKRPIYWILGASCTGKTVVCQELQSKNIAVCDMDARIFGDYVAKYSETRHPASCAWLKREDALPWALSLAWEEFNRLNEATNVEILDLFSKELFSSPETQPLVVDGGLSHPYLLGEILPVENIICLLREESHRAGTWDTDENKVKMKEMILSLPEGHKHWEQFRYFDRMIAATMENQCRQAKISLLRTREGQPLSEITSEIIENWKI
jgi:hypothetical protein